MASASGSEGGKCAICGRPSVPDYRPFCSRRCADVDLGRWLSGAYAIPDAAQDEDPPANGEAGSDPVATGSDPSP